MAIIGQKIETNDKEQQAYKRLLLHGWSPVQAAGIVGNLIHESGLDPLAEGDKGYKGGSSRGIAQFRETRLKKLQSMYGNAWTDFNNQIDFVNWELNNTHKAVGNALRKATTISDAGRIVSDKYEVPAKKFFYDENRQRNVFDSYRKLTGIKVSPEEQTRFAGDQVRAVTDTYKPYVPYTPPSMIPTREVESVAVETPKNEDVDTEQEVAAKQTIDRATMEQQIIQDYFAQNTSTLPQIPQQTQEVAQEEYSAPDLIEQFSQVSQLIENPIAQEGRQIPISSNGVYDYPGQEVIVPTQDGRITMRNINYPIFGVDEFGNQQMMYPEGEYQFKGKTIYEIPQLKNYFNKR